MTNVLVVDNNKSTSRTFKLILQKRGSAIVVVEDVIEVVEKIKANRFDAGLMSLENPSINGKNLFFFSKKNLYNFAKPVTTGFTSLEKSINTLDSGADAVFSKPIHPEQLIAVTSK